VSVPWCGPTIASAEIQLLELVRKAGVVGLLQKDLPEQTGLSKGCVSENLTRLEQRDQIKRLKVGTTNRCTAV
jgi:predicted transcriptional regulator